LDRVWDAVTHESRQRCGSIHDNHVVRGRQPVAIKHGLVSAWGAMMTILVR
jgi:hypothetical protein